jgi:hypothetical protein
MVNVSAAMGVQFAEAVTRMTERIRGLGLNPLRPDADIGPDVCIGPGGGDRIDGQRREIEPATMEPNGG